ncbi:hypothetical protein MMC15_004733 [Xylographa vitiligo]|nr:hypothetical protein [Xylographa vitiligo]
MDPHQPSDPTLKAGSQCLAALSILRALSPQPRTSPPNNPWTPRPLPPISQERIQQATSNTPSTPPLTPSPTAPFFSPEKEPTVLYLAYGSNLCAETFQGRRGIRPLAATSVAVPSLSMTFDLPGLPYAEPCFANTTPREFPPATAPTPPRPHHRHNHNPPSPQPTWPHGLVGVVYEVTPRDYAHIIATEGGGASYQDILVRCYALQPGIPSVPCNPPTPHFHAHTLFAPPLAPSPRNSGSGLPRPAPPLAQPSPRYLALIRAGAAEHALPPDYAAYLARLRPYTPTSPRQRLGGFVFLAIWLPLVGWLLALASRYAGEGGRSPPWVVWLIGRVFGGMWGCYDGLFRGLFGEGEWTVEGDGGEGDGGGWPGEGDGWGEKGGMLQGGVGGDAV